MIYALTQNDKKTKIDIWIQPSRHRPWISVGPPRADRNTDHSRPWHYSWKTGSNQKCQSKDLVYCLIVCTKQKPFFLTSGPLPMIGGRLLGRLNCQNKCWQCMFLKTTSRSESQDRKPAFLTSSTSNTAAWSAALHFWLWGYSFPLRVHSQDFTSSDRDSCPVTKNNEWFIYSFSKGT